MSMKYIRDFYEVPAKRGMFIAWCGQPCTITGSYHANLRVRMGDDKASVIVHPLDDINWNYTEATE